MREGQRIKEVEEVVKQAIKKEEERNREEKEAERPPPIYCPPPNYNEQSACGVQTGIYPSLADCYEDWSGWEEVEIAMRAQSEGR